MKKMCALCKYAGKPFKLGKITHVHCENKEKHPAPESVWDTLCEFYYKCDFFKPKKQKKLTVK